MTEKQMSSDFLSKPVGCIEMLTTAQLAVGNSARGIFINKMQIFNQVSIVFLIMLAKPTNLGNSRFSMLEQCLLVFKNGLQSVNGLSKRVLAIA